MKSSKRNDGLGLKRFIKGEKVKKFIRVLGVLFLVGFAIYAAAKHFLYGSIIGVVKNGYFTEDITEATIGEMMGALCSDGEWKYEVRGSVSCVIFTGEMKGKPVEMGFQVFNVFDTPVFQLAAFSLDGKEAAVNPLTGQDELSTIPYYLYKAYKIVKAGE